NLHIQTIVKELSTIYFSKYGYFRNINFINYYPFNYEIMEYYFNKFTCYKEPFYSSTLEENLELTNDIRILHKEITQDFININTITNPYETLYKICSKRLSSYNKNKNIQVSSNTSTNILITNPKMLENQYSSITLKSIPWVQKELPTKTNNYKFNKEELLTIKLTTSLTKLNKNTYEVMINNKYIYIYTL